MGRGWCFKSVFPVPAVAYSTLFNIGGQESSAWDTGWEMFTLLTNTGGDLLVLKSVAARLHHRLLVQARVNAQIAQHGCAGVEG